MELDAFLVGDELLKSSQSAAEKMGPQALLQQLQSCSLRKLKTLSTCDRKSTELRTVGAYRQGGEAVGEVHVGHHRCQKKSPDGGLN